MELLRGYYDQHDIEVDGMDDLMIKRYDFIEEGVLGADIRNKLSPIQALLDLLKFYKENKDRLDWDHKEFLETKIVELIGQCQEIVNYLSKLI